MDFKKWISALDFTPKEGAVDVYTKQYPQHGGYHIDVDFARKEIHYNEIVTDSKTTSNLSQPENFVVLECVDRLLRQGYSPQNIILEKVWRSGHGTSGRLDICVTRDNGSPYLLIECKTYGREFDKELVKTRKDGGQLFTYFQLSGGKADVIMLYASDFKGNKIGYKNEIIKIEDEYRSGDVKDIYEKWNKLTKGNGIFDEWAIPYNFESRALTIDDLTEIKPDDSGFIFNRFLEILRHNVVSDKPNAFNKIFTLFLCKIYDEKEREGTTDELQFQWLEGVDDDISFQLRLSDLYKNGMYEFLEKRVTDFSEEEFSTKYKNLDDTVKTSLLQEFKKIRLEKNNEFAIKEVYDEKSFKENAKVVKQVVELLQGYKIRYATKQQYLSDFFELLLTTGLKQESGQFFTPVPIAQFIIKSLPIDSIVESKLKEGKANELLPYIIDYAAGSGHFITESMNEIQRLLDKTEVKGLKSEPKKFVEKSKIARYDWAIDYIYGVEKDYRLVKVGKVGCYLHGDGLANVIHSDGLARFGYTDYKNKLCVSNADFERENKQFDVVVSNPPYSVAAFKNAAMEYYGGNDFELYDFLTDNSSEIECLFVERTKQLLKDGGVAGVILPSSILSNAGIYTKAREMILQYFDIVAITELGSNTFMATGTNTVVLFLRRRNNYDHKNIREAVEHYVTTLSEVTINGIQKPITKYVAHVWEGLDYSDYLTLLQKSPNEKVKAHEIYAEYRKKIKVKDEAKFWQEVVALENEKLTHFVIAYPQKVVLVKSGEKDAEKRFLGYEFSNRRGNEGIHPIQRDKNIDECTQLFDAHEYDNPDKASTYIQRAFKNDFDSIIAENMQGNVSRTRLVDMIIFDRAEFEKTLLTAIKKKVKIESRWDSVRLGEIAKIATGNSAPQNRMLYDSGIHPFVRTSDVGKVHLSSNLTDIKDFLTENGIVGLKKFNKGTILFPKSGASTFLNHRAILGIDAYISSHLAGITADNKKVLTNYLYTILTEIKAQDLKVQSDYPSLNENDLANIQIPLPPLEVQQKIVAEIEVLEKKEAYAKNIIDDANSKIDALLSDITGKELSLNNVAPFVVESTKIDDISLGTYITTDNMSQNKMGVIPFVGTTNISSITKYRENDILMSNIRPYLKKIWLADREGGSSKDVLVFRVSDYSQYHPKFIYYMMRRDMFFDYVMEGKKGVKMPRGNKAEIMKYKIPIPSLTEQQRIISEVEALEKVIAEAQAVIDSIPAQKSDVLKKYL